MSKFCPSRSNFSKHFKTNQTLDEKNRIHAYLNGNPAGRYLPRRCRLPEGAGGGTRHWAPAGRFNRYSLAGTATAGSPPAEPFTGGPGQTPDYPSYCRNYHRGIQLYAVRCLGQHPASRRRRNSAECGQWRFASEGARLSKTGD